MTQANFKQPLCLLIGGEKRGLSRTVVELSDHFVQIFYPTQIKAALSAAASAAVLCFEVVKQRMEQ
jgi:23S rRNA (guanosine2251-2'-O)-methyltransferase